MLQYNSMLPFACTDVLFDVATQFVLMSAEQPVGFWGKVDASMDWCEGNYVTSRYVAEWWNTLSSLPMVFYGLYGFIQTRRHASTEWRYTISFLLFMCVGIGSTLFHMTLRHFAQMLDELPMLWAVAAFVVCITPTHTTRNALSTHPAL